MSRRRKIAVGDIVRVDGERGTWRVEGRTRDGMLTLEALAADPRVSYTDLPEGMAEISEAFV